MMTSFVFANPGNGGHRDKVKKTVKTLKAKIKEEQKVDSFKVVAEESSEDPAGRKFCSITVNYYYQGHYVGQHTYTGYTCPILGESTCREWRANSLEVIQDWVHDNETIYPYHDITC